MHPKCCWRGIARTVSCGDRVDASRAPGVQAVPLGQHRRAPAPFIPVTVCMSEALHAAT